MPSEQTLSAVIQGQGEPVLGNFNPGKIAEMILNIKKAKTEQATQNLDMLMKMAPTGLVDDKQLEKGLKDWQKASGVKLADPKQAKAVQAMSKAGAQPSGAQSATPVSPEAAKKAPAGGVEPTLSDTHSMVEKYLKQIRESETVKQASETAKAKLETKAAELKTAALGGDQASLTQLQSVGLATFDKDLELKKTLTPDEYRKMALGELEKAQGLEQPKDKADRLERTKTALVAQGYTYEQAKKEIEKPGSSGVKKTFKQMSDEADYFYKLQESFGDDVAKKIAPQLAGGAALTDVLPNVGNYQSHFAQQMAATKAQHEEQMKVERERIAAERERTGVESARLSFEKEMGTEKMGILSDKIQLELDKAENSAFRQNVLDFIEMKKSGAAIPKEVEDRYVQDLAKRVGMKKEESQSWLNYLSFGMVGSKTSYAPDTDASQSVLDKALGSGPTKYAAPKGDTAAAIRKAVQEGRDSDERKRRSKATQDLGRSRTVFGQ